MQSGELVSAQKEISLTLTMCTVVQRRDLKNQESRSLLERSLILKDPTKDCLPPISSYLSLRDSDSARTRALISLSGNNLVSTAAE